MGLVKISPGNTKMGAIPSVSLPSVITCIKCGCNSKCYAAKLERLRPSVKAAYQNNLDVLLSDPEQYWKEVRANLNLTRYFRFHVSGDIPDADYFSNMVESARLCDGCEILCFTKKYEIVNSYIKTHVELPENLHIIFSGWAGLKMDNPFSLPEAHVRYRDGSTTASSFAAECGGNCTECAVTDDGCWTLKRGEQVIFNEH